MPKATTSDRPLLASAPVIWSLREGTRPVVVRLDVTPDDGNLFAADAGQLIDLQITQENGNIMQAQKLSVLFVAPGENPFIKRIVLADRRWTWSYRHVRRGYNVTRQIGVKRLSDPNTPQEIQANVDDIGYQKWSLKNQANLWNAVDMLKDVIQEASGIVPQISDGLAKAITNLPVLNLQIDCAGDQAVATALAYLPEAMLYIDYAGNVIVKSKVDGAEDGVLESLGPEMVGGGHIMPVSNRALRPKEMHILFTYEIEVRHDFIETTDTGTTLQNANADKRLLQNVLPLPDFNIIINGSNQSQGTWMNIDDNLFTAWGGSTFLTQLTHTFIQQAFVPWLDLWALTALAGSYQADANWLARIAAVRQNYRTTFRINRSWIDRSLALRAYRVATIDRVTGTRAPAFAWADYCVMSSQRSADMSDAGARTYSTNHKVYPWDPTLTAAQQTSTIMNIASTMRAAPCKVSLVDHDQGIIHLDYQTDIYGVYEQILPSMVEISGSARDSSGLPKFAGPSGNLHQLEQSIGWDILMDQRINNLAKLTSDHKMAVIITHIPGAPNDNRQFFKVIIKPKDIATLLPPSAQAGLEDALGPVMQIRVGAGTETARVPWRDADATMIERAFGIGQQAGDIGESPIPSDRVINYSESIKGASLWDIAKATAARIYASLADRQQGTALFLMKPDAVPSGWIGEISHELTPDGEEFTRVALPERIEPFDLLAWLDSSTRAFLIKSPTPERNS